jgi:hypothetical protein
MATTGRRYAYGRIKVLGEKLEQAHVSPETIAEIMEGGEAITEKTSGEAKADWMREAMNRMNRLLERNVRLAVREECACCLGGKRYELSKAIAKNHATLEERIAAANETRFVFGHSVTMQEDGRVLVRFAPEGEGPYRCVCLPKATEPLSVTYCYCCGGHVKHHLQTALGRPLQLTVRSSALSSGGERPCTFLFRIIEN